MALGYFISFYLILQYSNLKNLWCKVRCHLSSKEKSAPDNLFCFCNKATSWSNCWLHISFLLRAVDKIHYYHGLFFELFYNLFSHLFYYLELSTAPWNNLIILYITELECSRMEYFKIGPNYKIIVFYSAIIVSNISGISNTIYYIQKVATFSHELRNEK